MIVDEFIGSSKHSHPHVSYFHLDPESLFWSYRAGGGGGTAGSYRSDQRQGWLVGCSQRTVCKALILGRLQRLWFYSQGFRMVPKPLYVWSRNQVRRQELSKRSGGAVWATTTLIRKRWLWGLGTERSQSGQEVEDDDQKKRPSQPLRPTSCGFSSAFCPLAETVLSSQWWTKPHPQPRWTFPMAFHDFNYNTLFLIIFHVGLPWKGLNSRTYFKCHMWTWFLLVYFLTLLLLYKETFTR